MNSISTQDQNGHQYISVDRRLVVTLYLELLVKWPTKKQLHSSQQLRLARRTHSMDHFPLLQSMLLAGDQQPHLKVTNKQMISGCTVEVQLLCM